jgi:hypothetical protein
MSSQSPRKKFCPSRLEGPAAGNETSHQVMDASKMLWID